jgi:Fe-S cluster biogenesis protein NfuA
MIESTEATSAGSAAGDAGGVAIIGFDAGDGVGIGFCFSCAVVKLAAQRLMEKAVRKVIAVNLSFISISSNEFSFANCD